MPEEATKTGGWHRRHFDGQNARGWGRLHSFLGEGNSLPTWERVLVTGEDLHRDARDSGRQHHGPACLDLPSAGQSSAREERCWR